MDALHRLLLLFYLQKNVLCDKNSRWAHGIGSLYLLPEFSCCFFYVPVFFVRFFCKCWEPISVRAYACVRTGQSVKLGLAWSHDITGLRGLLASQRRRLLLLLLLFLLLLLLSPPQLLHSPLRYQARAPAFYILDWKPYLRQDSLGEFWKCFSWGDFVSVNGLYVWECTFVKAVWKQKKKKSWFDFFMYGHFHLMTWLLSAVWNLKSVLFVCVCVCYWYWNRSTQVMALCIQWKVDAVCRHGVTCFWSCVWPWKWYFAASPSVLHTGGRVKVYNYI